jgi:integrase/recombinase XerD
MSSEREMNLFVAWMKDRRLSVDTINNYKGDIARLLVFLKDKGLSNVRRVDISEYLVGLSANGLGADARNRNLYSIRTFFKAMIDFEIANNDPTQGIKYAKKEKNKLPTFLEEEVLESFFNSMEEGKHFFRNLSIFSLMAFVGLRIGEVAKLNISDINKNSKIVSVLGKGKKWRYIPIPDEVIETLDKYIYEERLDPYTDESDVQPLFISQFRRRMSKRMMQSISEGLFDKLEKEIPEIKHLSLSAHKLRHTFATNQVESGTDLLTLRDILGHTDIKTTEIYTHVTNKRIKEAMGRVKVIRPKSMDKPVDEVSHLFDSDQDDK